MSLSQPQPQPHSLKRDHDSFNLDELMDLDEPFKVPSPADKDTDTEPQRAEPESDRGRDRGAAGGGGVETLHVPIPTSPVGGGRVKMEWDEMDDSTARRMSGSGSGSASLVDGASAVKMEAEDGVSALDVVPSAAQVQIQGRGASAALNGSVAPAAKKPKLTFAEREIKRVEKEFRDREKAEEKARKDREREAEREQKRIATQAEKAAKEEKKRVREQEKQRAEEEKRRKELSQKTLGSFFTIPAATAARRNSVDRRSESPAPAGPNPSLSAAVASPATSTPNKPEKTAYEKMFPDFFIYPNVTMSPVNRFERDEEASESLQNLIDSYILGNRSPGHQRPFDAESLFHLSTYNNVRRGRRRMPVREIMAEMAGKSTKPIDLTTDSQNTQIQRTNDLLRTIPMKFLKFQEDVRPPYRGTYTSRPVNGMSKLARNPLRRDLPDTNYDYDSEAEWIEDEDAEDLNSEGEEDEDLGEDGEDMEGFLDDENDEIANSKRLVLQGDLEPISTGLCWEDHRKRNTNVKMMPYRMEVILDHSIKTIDPFSSLYWAPTPLLTTMDPPRHPLNTLKSNSLSINGISTTSKSVKPFFTPKSDLLKVNPAQQPSLPRASTQSTAVPSSASTAPPPTANAKPKKLIPAEDVATFKSEIEGSNLSKVGLIEVLKKKFPGRSAAAIKGTLEMVAKRVGSKEADKRWVLVEDAAV